MSPDNKPELVKTVDYVLAFLGLEFVGEDFVVSWSFVFGYGSACGHWTGSAIIASHYVSVFHGRSDSYDHTPQQLRSGPFVIWARFYYGRPTLT